VCHQVEECVVELLDDTDIAYLIGLVFEALAITHAVVCCSDSCSCCSGCCSGCCLWWWWC
jgi:hypothetical protein